MHSFYLKEIINHIITIDPARIKYHINNNTCRKISSLTDSTQGGTWLASFVTGGRNNPRRETTIYYPNRDAKNSRSPAQKGRRVSRWRNSLPAKDTRERLQGAREKKYIHTGRRRPSRWTRSLRNLLPFNATETIFIPNPTTATFQNGRGSRLPSDSAEPADAKSGGRD